MSGFAGRSLSPPARALATQVLRDMQEDPKSAQKHMQNADVVAKLSGDCECNAYELRHSAVSRP